MTSAFSWQKSASLCPASFYTPGPNLLVTPGISWLPTFSFSPIWWKGHLFGVLVLEGLVGLHRTVQLQLLQHYWLWCRLGLMWYWMLCIEKRDHFVIFEVASKYCISDSFVHYEGNSISSKGFLPTLIYLMVIWIKFSHCSPFSFTGCKNINVHSCHLLFEYF